MEIGRQEATPFALGARIEARDAEWTVRTCTPTAHDGHMIRAVDAPEFVREGDSVLRTAVATPQRVPDGKT
ncbi:hypothetical protein ACQEU3_03500 [Spirillospora sp. CA-253888]